MKGLGQFVRMGETLAPDHMVRDISTEQGVFRWAYRHPELRFRVERAEGLRFLAEIAIPEVTFKTTGPVSVSAFINGKPLDSIRCPQPGKYEISKAVPSGWIDVTKVVQVTFEAEPRWVAPDDGNELSFLLYSAGFVD